jgi:hypothetical protein
MSALDPADIAINSGYQKSPVQSSCQSNRAQ